MRDAAAATATGAAMPRVRKHQVWSGGVNYIRPDSDRGTQTWNGPGIQLAAVNGRQLVVVQKERTVVYFELDASDNWDERGTKTFADEVMHPDLVVRLGAVVGIALCMAVYMAVCM